MTRDSSNHAPEDISELYDILHRLQLRVPASDTYVKALDGLRAAIDKVHDLVPPNDGKGNLLTPLNV
jgi:hypothetical protein